MIPREQRINAFIKLGKWLTLPDSVAVIDRWIESAYAANPWFTPDNVRQALKKVANGFLDEQSLLQWSNQYASIRSSKRIGVVMAGNIPAAGFFDALCVLVSGHTLLAKPSKSDTSLLRDLLTKLCEIEPRFESFVVWADKLTDADAFIATGSDNTARYFEYYFAKKPHIIRKNRVSVGVLSGHETLDELVRLGHDILDYYGFGCRNVAKLFVPQGYNWTPFFEAMEYFRLYCCSHHKFFNNYEYNRSVLLLNQSPHLENGFLIVLESRSLISPISVVH